MSFSNRIFRGVSRTIHIRKSTGEAAVLVLLGSLGVFAVVYSQQNLPLENPFGGGIGPRLFPQLAGSVMILMSVYLLSLLGWRRHTGTLDDEVMDLDVDDHVRVGMMIVFVFGYMSLLEDIGFLVTTMSILLLTFVTLGFRRYILAGVLALGFTLAIYALFSVGLGMPLPAPYLDELFQGGIL